MYHRVICLCYFTCTSNIRGNIHIRKYITSVLWRSPELLTLFSVGILLIKLPLIYSGICIVLGVTVFKYLEIIKRLYCYNIRERSTGKVSFVHSWGDSGARPLLMQEVFSWAGIQVASPAPPASSALPVTLNKAFLLTQYHLTCIAHHFEEFSVFQFKKKTTSFSFSNNRECRYSYL